MNFICFQSRIRANFLAFLAPSRTDTNRPSSLSKNLTLGLRQGQQSTHLLDMVRPCNFTLENVNFALKQGMKTPRGSRNIIILFL
jgi:hypothetical protein